MQFLVRRRRQTPNVIIVSLIDILIVLLIFLIVTTTFKRHPALQLALPESRQGKTGVSETHLVVTVAKQAPHLYLDTRAITLERLQAELQAAAAKNPQVTLSIRADTDAPFGQIVKVMDVAKAAQIKTVSAFTKASGP